jgi:phage terminase large subunit GpA-like protein
MPIPAWMPKELIARCGGKVHSTFRFSDAERSILRKRKPQAPSIWAEKNRIVRDSSIPGHWQNIITPYLAPLMDALRFPGVEMGIICKGPQTAVTEGAINLLGHSIEHAPGPAMAVYADKDTAKDIMRDRIMPMLQDSNRLRRYLSGAVGDESNIRVNLRHMVIFLAWAGSVSRLGTRPIRTLFLDEIDKYPESRREASPEALAEKRTNTWRGRRLTVKLSTPTVDSGPIWVAFTEEAHARFDWYVCCPKCGTMQLMIFDNIRWPEDVRDPETVLKDHLAVYQCAHCDATWDDAERDLAVRAGEWIERASGLELFAHLQTHRPGKLGFHIPSWLSYFVSLSEVARSFLKWKKSGRLKDLKDFMNAHKAEPWREQYAEREEDGILALCDDRPRGKVPGPVDEVPKVAALVAGIDTQASYFRYVIRAFGYGDTEESWLVQCGTAQNFSALDDLLWRSVYTDILGNEYRVKASVIDAMGAPGRTKQVYAWCAKHSRAMAYQGKQNQATPIAYSSIEFFPDVKGSKVRIPGGLFLRRVDTTFFKSDLAEKLTIAPGDPGTFWLHENSKGLLTDYAKEMCAEVFNPETLVWENPKQRPNHFWDCEVMCQVGAWELGLRNKKPPSKEKQTTKEKATRPMPPTRNMSVGERVSERLATIRGRR